MLATSGNAGALLSLFGYLSELSFLGDIIFKLLHYLKYKAIYESVCENLQGDLLGIMTLCLLISFETNLVYVELKEKISKSQSLQQYLNLLVINISLKYVSFTGQVFSIEGHRCSSK